MLPMSHPSDSLVVVGVGPIPGMRRGGPASVRGGRMSIHERVAVVMFGGLVGGLFAWVLAHFLGVT